MRNRVLAPIFKKLALIEQLGTGFRKITEALKEYPNIEIRFNEPGMAFQMQFVKKDYLPEEFGTKLGLSWD
ncbi:MAG: ATP-binding protein [Promethearchaeota archaeon]